MPAPQATGWHRASDTWFWANERGVRAKGWKRIGASWYFFDTATAAMRTGWVRDSGSWYYLGSSGAMATGWLVVDGRSHSAAIDKPMRSSGSRWLVAVFGLPTPAL